MLFPISYTFNSNFSYAILPNIYSVQYSNDVVAAK